MIRITKLLLSGVLIAVATVLVSSIVSAQTITAPTDDPTKPRGLSALDQALKSLERSIDRPSKGRDETDFDSANINSLTSKPKLRPPGGRVTIQSDETITTTTTTKPQPK